MTASIRQREKLQAAIWRIANDVRGSVDGWDFKQYVLGTLFYRFISENFRRFLSSEEEGIYYDKLRDEDITSDAREFAIMTKGYFIPPSRLFCNVVEAAPTNPNLNTDLREIFSGIEASAIGYASEEDIKGLFADFDTTSSRLGQSVEEKNRRLTAVLKGVASLDFGDFEDNEIDLFGDAYEFLISNYAANAGKSGGEFFTPQSVSKLIAKIALLDRDSVDRIYDPAVGSGSLLLQAKKLYGMDFIKEGFYGQEINHTTYNLARMNMFLHDVNYDKFDIALGDTLLHPAHPLEMKFDAIVSNPPYAVSWVGSDDPTLINDDRFAPAGVLAPKSKADFAFVLHSLFHLRSGGRAAIVCFPGIFYRGGAEQKIREYLVTNNYVEAVIALPPNLFFGTGIAVNILVLSRGKVDTMIRFIDASGEDFYRKVTNNNILEDEHIDRIVELFRSREEVAHVATSVDSFGKVKENDYNLSVTSYVEPEDKREVIDIRELNGEISETVEKITRLREDITDIVTRLEKDA